MLERARYNELLINDEQNAFSWEILPDDEVRQRQLLPPHTNLGSGRGRFWELLQRLSANVDAGQSICDFGAYPGTTLRLIRTLERNRRCKLAAAGFAVCEEFRQTLVSLDAHLDEMEFDIRFPAGGIDHHILTYPIRQQYDVCICTEVIEHQIYPLSLLVGLNRFVKLGGTLYLTTNSVSFVGDVLKLLIGRHNIESLDRSHVLIDSDWRPHIRLFTLSELVTLLELAGFEVVESLYFDNGNVYAGLKGKAIGIMRSIASVVPHLRSHIFVTAHKTSESSELALQTIRRALMQYGLGVVIQNSMLNRCSHI